MSDTYAAETQSMSTDADKPEVLPARAALVNKLLKEIEEAEKKWEKPFKRMRDNMRFASGKQYMTKVKELVEDSVDDPRIKVEVIQRHISQRTAALYARNPVVIAKRRPRLEFAIWDGRPETLMKAAERYAATGVVSPQDEQLFMDVQQGMGRREMLTRLAKTLQLLYTHYMDVQDPPFKTQTKGLIPRALTCGVGYIKVGYQRIMGKTLEDDAALEDVTRQLAQIEKLKKDAENGDITEDSAEYDRLVNMMRMLANKKEVILREGLTFAFPRATSILPDCNLSMIEGFLGCHWVAEKHYVSREDVEMTYGVKLPANVQTYSAKKNGEHQKDKKGNMVCVYEMRHKRDGLVYYVTPGHNDFLQEPAEPDVYIRQFWPWVPLVFNRTEDDENPFPRSDVELLKPLQLELNRTFESLRQHRIASRPLYVTPPGALDEEDRENLEKHPAHAIIELANLPEDGRVDWVLKQVDKAAIDPNVYSVAPIYEAIARVVGGPDVSLGGNSRGSATGDSIAESSRVSALASNADDLDEALSLVAEIGGGILLSETQEETVKSIVGPGAVWPEFQRQDIANEMYLTIRGGSTGRPNKAQDIANFERMYPLLVQLTGLNPDRLTEYALNIMDDSIDLAEFMSPGTPSIVATNANAQPSTGNPASDPNAQGGQGGNNQSRPDRQAPGGQPAYASRTEGPAG